MQRIHDVIVNPFKAKHPTINSKPQLYGYDFHNETLPNIRNKMLAKHKKLNGVEFFDYEFKRGFNGRKLSDYVMKPKLKNGFQEVDAAYLKMYLLYLDCENVEQFKQKYLKEEDVKSVINHQIVTYEVYYYFNYEVSISSFELDIDFGNDTAWIKTTRTKTRYEGTVQKLTVNTCLNMESTNMEEKKILHILLYRGTMSLKDRNLSMGVYINTSERGHPMSGLMVLLKKDYVQSNPNMEDIKANLTKYLKNTYITMNSTMVLYPEDLSNHVEKKFPDWRVKAKTIENLAGDYYNYTIRNNNDNLLQRITRILPDGTILFKGSNGITYQGTATCINRRNILIEHSSKDGLSTYYHVVRLAYEEESEQLRGEYVGVNNDNQPINGKTYLIKSDDNCFDKEETKYVKHNSEEFHQLMTEYQNLEKHFYDKKSNHLSLDLKSGDKNSLLQGYYSMYYLSVSKSKMIIRKVPLYISPSGNVRATFKYNVPIKGRVVLKGSLLYIVLEAENGLFLGIVTIFSEGEDILSSMTGVYTSHTADGAPIARKVTLLKDENLKHKFQSEQIFVGTQKFHEFNQINKGLGDTLTGEIGNFIKAPKENNFTHFESNNNYNTHFYHSALYQANQGNFDTSLEALELAIRHGFNDFDALRAEVKEGVLAPMKDKVANILRLVEEEL